MTVTSRDNKPTTVTQKISTMITLYNPRCVVFLTLQRVKSTERRKGGQPFYQQGSERSRAAKRPRVKMKGEIGFSQQFYKAEEWLLNIHVMLLIISIIWISIQSPLSMIGDQTNHRWNDL